MAKIKAASAAKGLFALAQLVVVLAPIVKTTAKVVRGIGKAGGGGAP